MRDDDQLLDEAPANGVLPWSIEAESSVVGSLLLDNGAWDRVGDILQADDFYRFEHRTIFGAVAAMVNAGKAADVVTVFEYLQSQGKESDAGGLPYINQLAQYIPSASNVRRYAEIVAERALMRRLLAAADKARELAIEPGMTAVERLDRCMDQFQSLTVNRGGNEPQAVGELVVSVLDRINDLERGEVLPGILTKLPSWDRFTSGGNRPGKQVVIAARPSVGKTALALTIAKHAALAGHPVAVLSMEMEKQELIERYLADIGQVDLGHLMTGKLEGDEWSSLSAAVETLNQLPIYIDDQPAMTLADIQIKARKLKRERGIKLLVADYLQLIAPSDPKASRHHQIEAISRGLKVLGKQLGLTTIVLSQLNREVEKRTDKRATLGDLKESGAIEEDADVIVLLSNDHTREDGTQVIHAEMAKNRGGRKGFFKLALTGKYQRIVETVDAPDTRFRGSQSTPTYSDEV
jgi:replicative DNA helicase